MEQASRRRDRESRAAAWPWAVVGLCVAVAGWAAIARATRAGDDTQARVRAATPQPVRADRYATSDSCRACHPGAYASWHQTYHRTMTQRASPEAIAGLFDGRSLGPRGAYRVGRGEYDYWVEVPAASGEPQRHRVVMVTGSHHMQVYWVQPDADDGRLIAFPYAFLIPEKQWVPNEATLLRPTDEHVTYTWNRVCIKCHAVAGVPGYEPGTGAVRSGVAELGIACEACHGPAQEHIAKHRNPLARYIGRFAGDGDPTIVQPANLEADRASQICAQCHSITAFADDASWVEAGHEAAPPDPVAAWGALVRHPLDADLPWTDTLLDGDPDYFANRFWYDGMVRVSGREYNGVVESPCSASADFGCLSCHRMHGADPNDQLADADPDAPCQGCHPVIAATASEHSHHLAGSVGNRCVNCHMPHTTYGLLGAIRSHEISSPNLREEVEGGRPNACALCHVDRTLQWTADALARWYDQPIPSVEPETDAAAVRWFLAGDAGQRALAAWHLGWEPALQTGGAGWSALLLAEALDDPYPAVRWVAYRSLRRQPGFEHLELGSLEATDRQTVFDVQARWPVPASIPWGDAVPVGAGGLDRARVEALRRARDERPVALAE